MSMHGERMFDVSDRQYSDMEERGDHTNRHKFTVNFLKENVSLKGAKVFDFGCGSGFVMRMLQDEGAHVTGCDVSDLLVSKAPSGAMVGGVDALRSLAESSLDVLLAISVFPFMTTEEQREFWRPAWRALKPNGIFYFAAGNILAVTPRNNYRADPRTFPLDLTNNGFREFNQDYYNYWPFPWTRALLGIKGRISNLEKQKRIPKFIRRYRCSIYYSLSRRVDLLTN